MSEPAWRRALSARKRLIAFYESDDRKGELAAAQDVELAIAMHRGELSGLRDATTWSVSDEMVRVVAHAARTMPAEPLLHSDPWSPSGFVWLDEPVGATGIEGRPWPWRIITWRAFPAVDGRSPSLRVNATATAADLTAHLVAADEYYTGREFEAGYVNAWHFGEPAPMFTPAGPTPNRPDGTSVDPEATITFDALLKALWTIAAQPLGPRRLPATITRRDPPSATCGHHRTRRSQGHPAAPPNPRRQQPRRRRRQLDPPMDRERVLAEYVVPVPRGTPSAVDPDPREGAG